MSVFAENKNHEDSIEEAEEAEELFAEVAEAADAANDPLNGDGDEETIMRNFLLRNAANQNIKFDYRDDKTIMGILKLKGEKLTATFNYVRAQVKEADAHGLTNAIVDNLANLIYRIDNDSKTRDRILHDDKLRTLVHRKIGAFDFIPDWAQLAVVIGSYLSNAFQNRRIRQNPSTHTVLPVPADSASRPRV